ncbi:alkaline phosphatase D family protein [Microbulbifer taiwanensis]|uniref:Alkaline phosphatase D family protein n=2 Tax=Microbulbifer taiwanensis TaxID=986746 RepID=A0ABW1YHN4_9GAMM
MTNIVAGPFLRHVHVDQVNIFLALDGKPADAKAVIFGESGNTLGQSENWQDNLFRVAPNLYVLMLRAVPDGGSFAVDCQYNYNVSVDGQDLHARGMLSGELALGYEEGKLPSFYLPAFHRRTVSASCRKPHACLGDDPVPDQLIEIDRLIGADRNSSERPSRLVLTGDQIYADDVAPPLLALCELNAEAIMGKKEHVRLSRRDRLPFKPTEVDLDGRYRFLTKDKGFTSGAKKSHLVTYGEYLAMYLLVWGANVSRTIPGFEQVRHRLKDGDKPISTARYNWNNQCAIVENFLEGSRKVARLMANIPTYMIFDDHDVTDDWNLTRKNHEMFSSGSILSRNLLVNALSAYTVFQHWGNNPVSEVSSVLSEIQKVYGELGFDLWHKLEPYFTKQKRLYFGYAIESSPPMLVLDTRTHRSFKGGLALMDNVAFSTMQRQLDSIDTSGGPLVLVSPTPVYGYNLIEALQLAVGTRWACAIDREPWIANQSALDKLRRIIANFEFDDIYVLSGDVHYSFARRELQVDVGQKPQNWWQLTTSPCCNVPVGGKIFYSASESLDRDGCWARVHSDYLSAPEDPDTVIQGYCNYGLLDLQPETAARFTVCRAVDREQKQLSYTLQSSAPTVSMTLEEEMLAPVD